MNFRNLMIVSAVSGFVFGAAFVIVPGLLGSLLGLATTPAVVLVARLYGTALLGVGILSWLVKDMTERTTQQPILLAFLVIDFGGFLVLLMSLLSGLMNVLGWFIAIFLLVMSAAWAYLLLAKKSTA